MNPKTFITKLDWATVGIWLSLMFIGVASIFASIYNADEGTILDIFDTSQRYGMQFIWIGSAVLVAIVCLLINSKFYSVFAWPIYLVSILSLIAVLVVGIDINGSKSWFALGSIRLQPAEFAKIACSLALARLMSVHDFKIKTFRGMGSALGFFFLPPLLIVLENEMGLALVFAAFFLVLYREGLSGWVLVFGLFSAILFILSILWEEVEVFFLIVAICAIGYALISRKWGYILGFSLLFAAGYRFIPGLFPNPALTPALWFIVLLIPFVVIGVIYAFRSRLRALKMILLSLFASIAIVYTVDYLFEHLLKEHQQARIHILLGMEEDLQGRGYNVHQSKVAIGSGGFWGKGFLKGTQTKYNFVPEQTTDFIFCTIGEEWGFVGSFIVIALFLILFYRIILIAERQKDHFTRIYGYCVVSCIFFHFCVNIAMTIGIMPVIGIPLPFISYGGSSLWSSTILLFILLKLDTARW
jgi:rod shape determining protein RodA